MTDTARRTMRGRRAPWWLLLVWMSILPSPVVASRIPRMPATPSSGISVSVQVPSGRLPWGALVRVTMTVRNVSRHVVALPRTVTPNVVVTTTRGRRVYDSHSPFDGQMVRPIGGKPMPDALLSPGAVRRVRRFVLLRGATVRGYAYVRAGDIQTVRGRRVHVLLGPSDAPPVAVRPSPVPSASIATVVSPTVLLYYTEQVSCSDGTVTLATSRSWIALSSTTVQPRVPQNCPGPWRWLAIAGVLNHSAVTIDLRQPVSG